LIQVVVDAAVALAWCFPDEWSEYADGMPVSLEGKIIQVPALGASKSPMPFSRRAQDATDAAYLDLSIRTGAALATLDGKLQTAAEISGVALFT
jgi:hypothetical protein